MSEIQPPPPAPVPAYNPAPNPAAGPVKATNGLAIAGFVLGLLGFLGSFIPVINVVGIVMGVVGAILAAIGLAKAKTTGAGKGLALTGLILGGLALIIGVAVNVVFAAAVNNAVDDIGDVTVSTAANTDDGVATDDATDVAPDSAVGTARDNPAPLGSAITDGDWTVTINSVTTATESSIGQTPEAGSTLIVINMTAIYNGTDSQGDSAWTTVKFVTAEGTTIGSLDGSTLFMADDEFDSLTTLYEGGSVTGNQMLEVPTDGWQNGVLAVSPAMFSDDTFVAVQ